MNLYQTIHYDWLQTNFKKNPLSYQSEKLSKLKQNSMIIEMIKSSIQQICAGNEHMSLCQCFVLFMYQHNRHA